MKGGGGGGGLSVTGKWRWRGLVIGVLFLVILSMLVHLAFLLGVRNGFHSPNPNGNVALFAFGSVTSCCNQTALFLDPDDFYIKDVVRLQFFSSSVCIFAANLLCVISLEPFASGYVPVQHTSVSVSCSTLFLDLQDAHVLEIFLIVMCSVFPSLIGNQNGDNDRSSISNANNDTEVRVINQCYTDGLIDYFHACKI